MCQAGSEPRRRRATRRLWYPDAESQPAESFAGEGSDRTWPAVWQDIENPLRVPLPLEDDERIITVAD